MAVFLELEDRLGPEVLDRPGSVSLTDPEATTRTWDGTLLPVVLDVIVDGSAPLDGGWRLELSSKLGPERSLETEELLFRVDDRADDLEDVGWVTLSRVSETAPFWLYPAGSENILKASFIAISSGECLGISTVRGGLLRFFSTVGETGSDVF